MHAGEAIRRTFREEAFSFFTHLGGALLAAVGFVVLLERTSGSLALAAVSIYGVTLVAMFAASALYHSGGGEDGPFRKLDMTAIYIFIAGTYTPVCLLALPPAWGWTLLVVVWTLAAVGVVLRWALPRTPPWLTAVLYLGLGWIGVVAVVPLSQTVAWQGIGLLFAGGLIYTVGAVVYAAERPDPWPRVVGHHGLWHLFVLAGALAHFVLVWRVIAA